MDILCQIIPEKKYYLISAIASLSCGLIILKFFNYPGFLRYYAGDILIIIFLYSLLMILPSSKSSFSLFAVLGLALILEILQLTNIQSIFKNNADASKVILGTNFDWIDIVTYFTTGTVIFFIEKFKQN